MGRREEKTRSCGGAEGGNKGQDQSTVVETSRRKFVGEGEDRRRVVVSGGRNRRAASAHESSQ